MEMERINENTIRVVIENQDLEERGITFLDLLGNPKEIESFFYSILEEVDVEEQFQETEAVTFQVLPNRNGIELFISKNMLIGDDADLPELTDLLSEDSFGEFLKNQLDSGKALEVENRYDLNTEKTRRSEVDEQDITPTFIDYVIRFKDFDDLVLLSNNYKFDFVESDLYSLKTDRGTYYLHVMFPTESMTPEQIADDVALILEYGALSTMTPEVLAEYGKRIMTRSALEQTNHYFNK